ncbi:MULTISPECIES: AAA family ATPase [unclassified Haladaptatus]|uniref:AAA family ATPase n=1 Tax=unclassified Haladaptatus TaxID=2622732 RepID=UPI002FCE30DF
MRVAEAYELSRRVTDTIGNAVITEQEFLDTVLTGLLARGHVLLEDVPGTGKTLTARSLGTALGLSFSRIQFTPDLLPADVTGTHVFNEKNRDFEFKKGPIFANVVLADEINRASPKTQAALLEAMEEKQVTVDGQTHKLPDPFFVIATQNPAERNEGTFPLPEAQKDRFIIKTSMGYPNREGERELLARRESREDRSPTVNTVCSPQEVLDLQRVSEQVRVQKDVQDYIVDLTRATREDERVTVGASPRATQRLFEAARARAVLDGEEYVTPEHVKRVAHPVLDHRIVLTADARVNGVEKYDVIEAVLSSVDVPTITYATR